MNAFIDSCIKRPVLSSAMSIFILILGIFGVLKLPVRYLPKLNQAVVDINTAYSGVDNASVNYYVTNPIQKALVGIEGIDYIASSSLYGVSDIKIYLFPNVNPDKVLSDVSEKINNIQRQLPSNIESPVISKQSLDDQPMLILGFSNQSDYLRHIVEPTIEAVDGVGQANVWADTCGLNIELDPQALNNYHLTAQDVALALKQQNSLTASGKSIGTDYDFVINAKTNFNVIDEINNLIIKEVNRVPIYLKNIGYASWGGKNNNVTVLYDHQPTIMMGVNVLPDSNPISVIKAVLKKLSINNTVKTVLNRTTYITACINEVVKSLIESMIIVIFVIYLFLRDFRAALIPAMTIPLSILGICFFMQILGYSINTMTLLAMVLGVGLVVDDAIVIVENAVNYLSNKISIIESTLLATRELVSPVIAMTTTLAVIYFPIAFSTGLIGQLFKEFALTLAGSVIISGFISLTLSPMMASRLLRSKIKPINWLSKLEIIYKQLLLFILNNKFGMILLWILILLCSILFYFKIPSELTPLEDQGFLLVLGNAPSHANLNYFKQVSKSADDVYDSMSSIRHQAIVLSPDEGYQAYLMGSLLKDTRVLQARLSAIPGMDFHVITPNALSGSGSSIQFVLQSSGDLKELYDITKSIEASAMKSGLFLYLYDDLNYNNPEVNIIIDHAAAAALNIPMKNISDALSALMSHQTVTQFSNHQAVYDVVIKPLSTIKLTPEALMALSISTDNGNLVPLSSIAHIDYSVTPVALNQFQKLTSVTIKGAMLPSKTLSMGLNQLVLIATQQKLNNMTIDYAGTSRQLLQEGHRMQIIFSLAIIFIYLILSIQFNSYRDAFIILLGSVPMALSAGMLPLVLGWGTFNIYTQIGLLTLIGLISKHGILITQYANQYNIIEASLRRFRPILMTTMAVLISAVPLIMATGAGSAARHALGMVIGVGMALGTLMTLLLLPIVYEVLSKKV